MAITAQMVKELRDSTGAGMMDAKKALTETAGDMDAAVDWLRTKGLAKAAKKSGRVAAEGLIGVSVAGGRGVAVEVNSETDFVAKNDEFQGIVRAITEAAMDAADLDALNTARIGGKPVSEVMTDAIAKIGENMTLRRMATVTGETVVSYVHNAAAPGMGTNPCGGCGTVADRAARRRIRWNTNMFTKCISASESRSAPSLAERASMAVRTSCAWPPSRSMQA